MHRHSIPYDFFFDSFYSYDASGRYLTSVSIGNITLNYNYNENGDLIHATDMFGSGRNISYDENSWVQRIDTFDSNSEQISCMEYKTSWNGRLDIAISPTNTTHTLVHDKIGNVVSIASNGGLPERIVELPYGRQHLLGDEVSIFFYTISIERRKGERVIEYTE